MYIISQYPRDKAHIIDNLYQRQGGYMARRTKRAVRSSSYTLPASGPAYITRNIPFYEFLSEENLVKIENQADWICLLYTSPSPRD